MHTDLSTQSATIFIHKICFQIHCQILYQFYAQLCAQFCGRANHQLQSSFQQMQKSYARVLCKIMMQNNPAERKTKNVASMMSIAEANRTSNFDAPLVATFLKGLGKEG